jgi:hypothetical protein
LVWKTNKKTGVEGYFCRECGNWFTKEQIFPPKPAAGKLKQKGAVQSKPFITTLPERKKKGDKLGNEDRTSELSDSELKWVTGFWGGNITDSTDSES